MDLECFVPPIHRSGAMLAGIAAEHVPSREGDEAEDSLLRSLEERRRIRGGATATATVTATGNTTGATGAAWSPSVPGEQPPLVTVPGALDDLYRDGGRGRGEQAAPSPAAAARWQRVRHSLIDRKAKGNWGSVVVPADENNGGLTESNVLQAVADNVNSSKTLPPAPDGHVGDGGGGHIFSGLGGKNHPAAGSSHLGVADTDMDRLISGAAAIDELFAKGDGDDDSGSSLGTTFRSDTGGNGEESLPLTAAGRDEKKQKSTKRGGRSRRWRKLVRRTFHTHVWEALRPSVILPKLASFVAGTVLFGIAPLLTAAAVLFYKCGNPTDGFLASNDGGGASISYVLVFVARQLTTRALGGMSAYLLVQSTMRSKLAVKLFGAHLTILVINSEGWPLHAVCWALWDLCILQGNGEFRQNWLFFADIQLFSSANPGGDILSNTIYGRALAALLVMGLATALQRTVLALYFGKKLFRRYKHGLEKLLVDVLVVSEVAALSKETEEAFFDEEGDDADKNNNRSRLARTRWSSIERGLRSGENKRVAFGDDDSDDQSNGNRPELHRKSILQSSAYLEQCASERFGIGSLLVKWEEPVNKLDKEAEPTISDMLLFRKALAFMDGVFPFSRAFGPSSTRDECIASAQDTYQRLMCITPEANNLSFDVLALLAVDEAGVPDQKKLTILRRTFRPDRFNELNELAFVQSCDSVYRKLRYFRASVGNSSVIDRVIQDAMKALFYLLLILVACVIMHYNPWALLVSLSTLVVSMSFAVGAATSKFIEGVLLIVARRPYEIGDRIMIVGSENTTASDWGLTWFVEDVNLYNTTLRYSSTNEVATITNGSIAASRIINCARSSNALVTLTLKYTLKMTDEEASALEDALNQYVKNLPRNWVGVIGFRSDELDPDFEYIQYTMRIQHRKTWQDANEIVKDKAKLLKFMYETASKLGIVYSTPMRRFRLYPGEKKDEAASGANLSDTLMANAIHAAGLETSPK